MQAERVGHGGVFFFGFYYFGEVCPTALT